jgi:drug/metabolite transporter (DMT)-like permease
MLPWIWPQPLDFLAMAVCGAIAAAALTLLTQAYRVAPAALVAPFEYSFMFWALLWGWLFWGDLPDPLAWLGIAVIIGAGLHLLRAEARATAG